MCAVGSALNCRSQTRRWVSPRSGQAGSSIGSPTPSIRVVDADFGFSCSVRSTVLRIHSAAQLSAVARPALCLGVCNGCFPYMPAVEARGVVVKFLEAFAKRGWQKDLRGSVPRGRDRALQNGRPG